MEVRLDISLHLGIIVRSWPDLDYPIIGVRSFLIAGVAIFAKKHRRSPSHFNLKYGRENSPPDSPVKEAAPAVPTQQQQDVLEQDGLEVNIFTSLAFSANERFGAQRDHKTPKYQSDFIPIYTQDVMKYNILKYCFI